MSEVEVTPDVFTADYSGEPGARVFYLQARTGSSVLTYLVEKGQVSVLAEKLREMLIIIDQDDTIRAAPPARDPALGLVEPVEPEWRVGTMGLAYEDQDDRIVLFLQPVDDADDNDEGSGSTRLLLRRDQVRSFVLHAVAVVAEGRPLCQLCGLPMDPAGHNCPASNGHRATEV